MKVRTMSTAEFWRMAERLGFYTPPKPRKRSRTSPMGGGSK